jgi:hypothetical protein
MTGSSAKSIGLPKARQPPLSELVVDCRKAPSSYFEIEHSMLASRPNATQGGRWLNEGIIDFVFTL